jgi:hypothetical protein
MIYQILSKGKATVLFLLLVTFTQAQENLVLDSLNTKIIGSAGLNTNLNKIHMTGEIVDNTSEVFEKGYVYSTSEEQPTVNDSKIIVKSSDSVFETELEDLQMDAIYYLRPFAIVNNKTIYGTLSVIDTSKQSNIDIDTKNRIKTYPNPSTNFISLSGLMETKNYTIYSMAGKELARGSVYYNNKIDVRFLDKGLYLLKLADIEIIKFIKS